MWTAADGRPGAHAKAAAAATGLGRNRLLSVSDPYKVLQVDPEAEDEVIEAAYRRLARKYHPDVSPTRESQDRMVADQPGLGDAPRPG